MIINNLAAFGSIGTNEFFGIGVAHSVSSGAGSSVTAGPPWG
jgi:hypothetical protein